MIKISVARPADPPPREIVVRLLCDSGALFCEPFSSTAGFVAANSAATAQGWKRTDGLDLCPACSGKTPQPGGS